MKNTEVALPWFPITPAYIDQYHESGLITSRACVYTNQHKSYTLDMFDFYCDEKLDFDIVLKTIRAKNILIEQYPDTKNYLESLPDRRW